MLAMNPASIFSCGAAPSGSNPRILWCCRRRVLWNGGLSLVRYGVMAAGKQNTICLAVFWTGCTTAQLCQRYLLYDE